MTKKNFLGKIKPNRFVQIPPDITLFLNLKQGDLVEIEIQKVHANSDVKAKLFHEK